MKRKVEEQAKKAEERAKKAEVKAQKAAEKKEKKQGVKRKSVKAPNLAASRSKKCRVSDLALQPYANIDPNTCCTCFVRYEDDIIRGAGTEWISCACGRWLHEHCADDCVADAQGNDRTCLICLDILMA